MKTTYYLDELLGVVANIDKNKGDTKVISLADYGMSLVAKMRLEQQDTGAMQEMFSSIQVLYSKPELLPEIIDMTFDEIIRLVEANAWHSYCVEERLAA